MSLDYRALADAAVRAPICAASAHECVDPVLVSVPYGEALAIVATIAPLIRAQIDNDHAAELAARDARIAELTEQLADANRPAQDWAEAATAWNEESAMPATDTADNPALGIAVTEATATGGECAVLIAATGILDVYTAPNLREVVMDAINRDGIYRIVIDLAGVTRIDSSGLGTLVGAAKRARVHDGWLRLVPSPERQVQVAFRLSGLDKALSFYDTVQGALGDGEKAEV